MIRHGNTTRAGIFRSAVALWAVALSSPGWSQTPVDQTYGGPTRYVDRGAAHAAPIPLPPVETPPAITRVDFRQPADRSIMNQLAPVQAAPEPVPPGLQPVVEGWSLEQLAQLAETNNPAIAKAAAEIDAARGDARQAGLYPNPTFDTNTPELFGGPFTNANIGCTQQIKVKGKLRLDRAAAQQAVAQAEAAFVTTRFAVLTEVRSQFYSVLAAERRLAVQHELIRLAAATKKASEGRVKALEGTETEVLLLTVELQRAEAAARNTEITLRGLKRKLAATVGIPELPLTAARGNLFGAAPVFDEEQLRQFILSENSEVQQARAGILRNRLLLRRAQVEPFPDPYVAPIYFTGFNSASVAQQYGLTIMIDIPLWNRNQGNIQSQRGELAASTANLGVVQNELLGQAADTLSQHRAARQLADRILQDILPNSQKSLELTRNGYDRGLLDISTLLQAQRSLIQANLDLIEAMEGVWSTAAELAGILQQQQFP